MLTYLIKESEGKTYHFKASIYNNGVDIIQGVFYHWLSKSWEGCGNLENALLRIKTLVEEKIEEGYKITDYLETLENSVDVYNRIKRHMGIEDSKPHNESDCSIYTGFFLGWLIDNELISNTFRSDHNCEIEEFKKRKITAPNLLDTCCDGILMLEDVSERGNRFALPYLSFDSGNYLNDFKALLLAGKPNQYKVADNWYNYERLKIAINKRFENWETQKAERAFWKWW